MTTLEANSETIFADAQHMHEAALERMAAGDYRDAAEKAWCATLRATDALILARTGELPARSPATTRALRAMAMSDPRADDLLKRYFTNQGALHGDCFYTGLCEPIDHTERLIRETADYIQDAESLAVGVT